MSKRVVFAFLVAGGVLAPAGAVGQGPMQLAISRPQPHFVAVWAPNKEREAEHSAVLARRVALELANVSLDDALKTLTNLAGLRITYSRSALPADKLVTIHASDIAVVTALTEMLFRSGLDVVVDRDGTMALVLCRHPAAKAETPDSGAIVGRVTDKATGAPIVGATVAVEGGRWSATTDADGQYRLGGVEAGTQVVRARFIGYVALSTSVTVVAAAQVTVDLGLVKSVQKLDELVTVTPGGMQTQVKAIPTPVSVITSADIERQRPTALSLLFRQAVPTAVSVYLPNQPIETQLSVRGATSLAGAGVLKVFVDGVEAAAFSVAAVDPESIDRIEVIRGPQAATLYGADAVGGVVQITTKRGDSSIKAPRIDLLAQGGVTQTPYNGVRGVLRQRYSATVLGGAKEVSYNLGVGYSRLGDWLPYPEISRQSSPSVYGGMRYARGIVGLDLHARYFRNNLPIVLNPEVQATGLPFAVGPRFLPATWTNETFGAKLSVTPATWWHNQLTLGIDDFRNEMAQVRPRLVTPDDTLLQVQELGNRKASFSYNSSATAQLTGDVTGSLTGGIDYYRLDANDFSTTRALNTEGTIQTDPSGAFTESRSTSTNTGYFAQTQVSWRESVFLTVGLRADNNSAFGREVGAPVQPRIGLSVVRTHGQATVKVRGAYGRAIRTPSPGTAFGEITPFSITQANTRLAPERQRGWDGGVDLIFGNRVSLGLTGFSQTADNLIAFVEVPSTELPTFQYQNIGRVTNRGIEVEGTLSAGAVQLTAQYGYVRSRVDDLGAANLPGAQVQVGDRPLAVPQHTAGANLTVVPTQGTTLTVGATYVGSWRQADFLALFRCFAATGPCLPTSRDYIVDYPQITKFNLAFNQRLTEQLEALLTIDNVTNNLRYEASNTVPRMGRITMVGLRARL